MRWIEAGQGDPEQMLGWRGSDNEDNVCRMHGVSSAIASRRYGNTEIPGSGVDAPMR